MVVRRFSDDFLSDAEGGVAQCVLDLGEDPSIKAIVFCPAINVGVDVIRFVKERRPDIMFISCAASGDPEEVISFSDIVMRINDLETGEAISRIAKKMGAKTLVHYSFPRHLGYKTIALRRERIMEECEELGIEFVDAMALDPVSEVGIKAAREFIASDIRTKYDEYGRDTAIFCTNCGLQVPVIQTVTELGMIYPQQCCPSPFHGYPEAYYIAMDEINGNSQKMLESIRDKLVANGQENRMSTWYVSINQVMLKAGVYYADLWIRGEIEDRNNPDVLYGLLNSFAGMTDHNEIRIENQYVEKKVRGEKPLENYYLIMAPYVDFSDGIDCMNMDDVGEPWQSMEKE